jgi:hypothetical protein
MSDKISLARTAKGLTHATTLAILVLLIVYPALWIDPALAVRSLAPSLPGLDQADLRSWALAAGFGLGLIPLLVFIFGLWRIRQFFRLYSENDLFPAEAGRYLRHFGIVLLILVPVGMATSSAASILFSLHRPEGQKQLAIGISSSEIFALIVGALLMMIGRILSEAHRLAEENRQIV